MNPKPPYDHPVLKPATELGHMERGLSPVAATSKSLKSLRVDVVDLRVDLRVGGVNDCGGSSRRSDSAERQRRQHHVPWSYPTGSPIHCVSPGPTVAAYAGCTGETDNPHRRHETSNCSAHAVSSSEPRIVGPWTRVTSFSTSTTK